MIEYLLQLFGDGGDGGDGGSPDSTGESTISGEEVPAQIPDRAKKFYEKAVRQNKTAQIPQSTDEDTETKEDSKPMSYEDMIKSDQYKDAHKQYMDKTIGDRLKKYKGMEDNLTKAQSTLAIVAQKYGVDANSDNFLEVLNQKIEADDSYYEKYAMEHDISTEDARKMVTMERKLQAMEQQKAETEKQEQMRQQLLVIQQNAEKTKQRFPEFNLDAEMQDERFRRLLFSTQGDTTSAYMACHWNDVINNTVSIASRNAQIATTNAVASGTSRPTENGVTGSTASSVSTTDFSRMNLAELRAYADKMRRGK